MTHEEMLATIENKFNNQSGLHDAQIVNALYRVVELHIPDAEGGCSGCPYDIEWQSSTEKYPCETIKLIEKELL